MMASLRALVPPLCQVCKATARIELFDAHKVSQGTYCNRCGVLAHRELEKQEGEKK